MGSRLEKTSFWHTTVLKRPTMKLRQPATYRNGDLVWCKTHPLSSVVNKCTAKLMPRWSGALQDPRFPHSRDHLLGHIHNLSFVKKVHIEQLNSISHVTPPEVTSFYLWCLL